MGNKSSGGAASREDEFESQDPRGRSWSFHGIMSKSRHGKKGLGSFRGRSSSLSDATGSKGKKGVRQRRDSDTLRSNSSMSVAELRKVTEALYGDKLLLELVRRRGKASLNRDLSLSQTSMILALAAEGVNVVNSDTLRSASLHSLDMDRLQDVDERVESWRKHSAQHLHQQHYGGADIMDDFDPL
nr:hypothetical protein BaRGS_001728 [Batillaria attramentaria]